MGGEVGLHLSVLQERVALKIVPAEVVSSSK
jgi:hypothetical protein